MVRTMEVLGEALLEVLPQGFTKEFVRLEDGYLNQGPQLSVRIENLFVPFVNRPFESEIHGTVNFTQFCCVLLVTWCYRVLLSCYLRPK